MWSHFNVLILSSALSKSPSCHFILPDAYFRQVLIKTKTFAQNSRNVSFLSKCLKRISLHANMDLLATGLFGRSFFMQITMKPSTIFKNYQTINGFAALVRDFHSRQTLLTSNQPFLRSTPPFNAKIIKCQTK